MPKKADMVEVALEVKEKKMPKEKMAKETMPKAAAKGGMKALTPEVKEKLKMLIEKHKLDKSKAAKLRMQCMRGETPEKAIKAVMA